MAHGRRERNAAKDVSGENRKGFSPSLIYNKSFITKQMFVILKDMHINSKIHY